MSGMTRRPLVWQEEVYITTDDDNGPLEGIPRELLAWSSAPYVIIRQSSPDGSFILRGKRDGIGLIVSTLDEAKAAAQADYESRIEDGGAVEAGLVERLLVRSTVLSTDGANISRQLNALHDEAAAEITRLSAENAGMREVLEPFAAVAEHDIGETETDLDIFRPMSANNHAPKLTVGDLRRARAALSKASQAEGQTR